MKPQELESPMLAMLDNLQALLLLPKEQLEEMRSLVKAGEPGIALENTCTQLFEYDSAISTRVWDEIAVLGNSMGIRPNCWKSLRKDIPPSEES